jgi:hypothetical protein
MIEENDHKLVMTVSELKASVMLGIAFGTVTVVTLDLNNASPEKYMKICIDECDKIVQIAIDRKRE